MKVSVIGKGNMGQAIAKNFEAAGQSVEFIGHGEAQPTFGDLVVFAVPFAAEKDLANQYQAQLAGKIVVEIANPLNFDNWDELVVPSDSSAAEILQTVLPQSKVLKAFNTTFAGTLNSGQVGDNQTTVLVAGDDEDAKETFASALSGSPLTVMDAGKLKRAREMEALGFLQMTLAAQDKISWNGGFGINQ
ncbi:Dinucleotide-binding enzyme [Limosilactobacillus gastricus PS3]|uniref:Dinucleotide-binding enzyme n=1 Tax=Limosilactobacillus gastricus PS3 TaxID=1144300 RepID=H4GJ93_9LACO|nr:NADPH-dependent F420 reductase [Limosilactobacillus gastricus]EHS87048.1 Dinucleotide-binding enzyme [Limosilactobacillus gastricus PS3]